jgi:hypothetical protein
MGDGKKVRLPCGHVGEVIIGKYAECLQGCEGKSVPNPIETEKTERICLHLNQYGMGGHTWCWACGRKLK